MSSATASRSDSEEITDEELRRAAERVLDVAENSVVEETCEAVLRSLEPDDSHY